ncbi:MAG: hypothetical protein EXQ74_05590 [Thermoleophilia bacterium]|nr:hypothetical protein [Thermoleophilia bacterium]
MLRPIAVVVVLIAPSVALGATAWLPPTTIAPADRGGQGPAVAGNDDGRAIAAWATAAGVMVTLRTPGGPWYSPVRVPGSGRGATGVVVAMTTHGLAAVGWIEAGRVRLSIRPARRRFLPAIALSPRGQVASSPRLAFGSGCAPIIAWAGEVSDGGSTIRATCANDAGRFGPTRDVSSPDERASTPGVAAGIAGAVVVWRQDDANTYRVRASLRAADETFSPPETISAEGSGALMDPAVTITPTGEAIAVWTLTRGAEVVAQASVHPTRGPWSRVSDISRPAPQLRGAQVGADQRGNVIATWLRSGVVQASLRPTGEEWGIPRDLSNANSTAGTPRMAISGSGATIVTWAAASDPSSYVVQAALRSPDGDFAAPVTISHPHRPAIAPQAAIGDDGIAPVAWQWTDPIIDPAIARSGVMTATGLAGSTTSGPAVVVDLLARPARVRPGQRITITFGLSKPAHVRITAARAGTSRVAGALSVSGADGANRITLEGGLGGASLGRGRWIIGATPRGGVTRVLMLIVT